MHFSSDSVERVRVYVWESEIVWKPMKGCLLFAHLWFFVKSIFALGLPSHRQVHVELESTLHFFLSFF